MCQIVVNLPYLNKDWPDEFLMFFKINHVFLNLQNVLSLVLEVEIPSNFTKNNENAESAFRILYSDS